MIGIPGGGTSMKILFIPESQQFCILRKVYLKEITELFAKTEVRIYKFISVAQVLHVYLKMRDCVMKHFKNRVFMVWQHAGLRKTWK